MPSKTGGCWHRRTAARAPSGKAPTPPRRAQAFWWPARPRARSPGGAENPEALARSASRRGATHRGRHARESMRFAPRRTEDGRPPAPPRWEELDRDGRATARTERAEGGRRAIAVLPAAPLRSAAGEDSNPPPAAWRRAVAARGRRVPPRRRVPPPPCRCAIARRRRARKQARWRIPRGARSLWGAFPLRPAAG